MRESQVNKKIELVLQEQQRVLFKEFEINNKVDMNHISTIAGVDLAYWKELEKEYAVCCIVIIDYITGEIIEKRDTCALVSIPYMSGYLAFREMPLVLQTVNKLNKEPDIYMFDGNGYLHPRHMGVATHAGIVLKKPSIGIAKSYYKMNNIDYEEPINEVGAFKEIIIDNEVYGAALRTHKNVKPIFVSVGNMINLETSINIVKKVVRKESHIPLPTRYADIETHKLRELYKNKRLDI